MSKGRTETEVRKNREKSTMGSTLYRVIKGSTLYRVIKWSFILLFIIVLSGVATIGGIYYYISDELPKTSSLNCSGRFQILYPFRN